ncbi:MAG: hypothetical protein ACXVJN_03215 [Mucilaginibacter sp.]
MQPSSRSLYESVAVFFLLLFTCCCFSLNALATDGKDSVKIAQRHSVNLTYNQIYRENLPASFYGNEYGNPTHDMLTADYIPNVVLLNTAKSRFFFVITPRLQLRLLSQYHSPVRSPSYMPGASIFTRLNSNDTRPQFLSLSYSHHSNGQEGPTLNADGSFNREDGKFTTNFYTLNYYFGKRFISDSLAHSTYSFIGLEVHSGLFKLGYSAQLTDKYGFIRANGSWMYDILKDKHNTADHYLSRQRIRFDFTYILDKMYNYSFTDVHKRLNLTVKYYYQFGFMEDVACMIGGGFRGQDPYNIYFQDSYPYVAIGVASGLSFDMRKKHHYSAQ